MRNLQTMRSLLELSLFGLDGKEIYHCYYRPEMIDDWRTDIHHITSGDGG